MRVVDRMRSFWSVPLVGLKGAAVLAGIVIGLYVGAEVFDRLSLAHKQERSKANTCSLVKGPGPGGVQASCSSFSSEENAALNEAISEAYRSNRADFATLWDGGSEEERLRSVEKMASSYIYYEDFFPELGGDDIHFIKVMGGFILAALLVIANIAISAVSLVIYLFSRDEKRARKAGGVLKTSMGFMTTVGGTLFAAKVLFE